MPVTLICDTNHILESNYSKVNIVGSGPDAVDFALVNLCQAEILLSQSHGVAMAPSKGPLQFINLDFYTNKNIDQMLMQRHLNKKDYESF